MARVMLNARLEGVKEMISSIKEEKKMNAQDRKRMMVDRFWAWVVICAAVFFCDRAERA